jgi:hypothetical protein
MKFKLDYRYSIFLAAYFRQLYLSLHRSQHTNDANWAELVEYYENQIDPKKIYSSLKTRSNYVPEWEEYFLSIYELPKLNRFHRLLNFWLRLTQKQYVLSSAEVDMALKVLRCFDEMLKTHLDGHTTEMPNHKLDLDKVFIGWFNGRVLSLSIALNRKLLPRDYRKAMQVEHYLQNEILVTVPLRSFIEGFDV